MSDNALSPGLVNDIVGELVSAEPTPDEKRAPRPSPVDAVSSVVAGVGNLIVTSSLETWFAPFRDLALPETGESFRQLRDLFRDDGYSLDAIEAPGNMGKKARRYTLASKGSAKVALAHLPASIFRDAETVMLVNDAITYIPERPGRFLSSEPVELVRAHRENFRVLAQRDWDYVPWQDIADLLGGALNLGEVFGTDETVRRSSADGARDQRDLIVDIMATQGRDSPLGVDSWFKNLLDAAEIPTGYKDDMLPWTGNPTVNAKRVVSIVEEKGLLEPGGDSVLGRVLFALMMKVGYPSRKEIAKAILAGNMLTRVEDLAKVSKAAVHGS